MAATFDPAKDKANQRKHGISLARAEEFDFDSAVFSADVRDDYGEERIVALGFLDGELHVMVFTGEFDSFRVISLRKARRQEQRDYDDTF